MEAPTIMIADDDYTVRQLLKTALQKDGYEVIEASTGPKALGEILASKPDLVLLDIDMPGANGYTVCRELRADRDCGDIPVIFITAKDSPADIQRAYSVGGSDYIMKPFHMREVRARVSAQLRLAVTSRELEKSQAELLRAQKLEAIGQLAAGVAHEINTPAQFVGDNTRFLEESFSDLVGLLTGLQAMVSSPDDQGDADSLLKKIASDLEEADVEYLLENIPRALERSIHGLDRISKIVKAMKEFSHPGCSEKEQVNINRAIESTATVARNEWKYVADVEFDLDPDLPAVPCLLGDFNQVVLNLIVNAAHAIADGISDEGEERGKITVTTRSVGDCVEIRIKDTGTGIPEDIQKRIFDPFFTTKEVGKGTGQGLAIAHSVITDGHGGSIHCESVVGEGTTFVISLPISEPSSTRTAA